jgi:hypothetical protein
VLSSRFFNNLRLSVQ